MTVPDEAASEAERIALDDSHGYDQSNRWGDPDLDCSSLVIKCYKSAGVPLQSTYTGNMKADFLSHGFKDVTRSVDLITGWGLERGDVLLNEIHHTALYVGDGKIVHATGNEFGGVTGGKPGDQTGREICIAPYYNYGKTGWDCVLRYEAAESPGDDDSQSPDYTYVVKPGDSLWAVATANNMSVDELAKINGLDPAKYIYPGQVLMLKPIEGPGPVADDAYVVKPGDSLWQIAQILLGSGWRWHKIAAANDISFPYTIHPGERLKIPKGGD